MLFAFLFGHSLILFLNPTIGTFFQTLHMMLFCCRFFPFVHGAVFFMSSSFFLLLVICTSPWFFVLLFPFWFIIQFNFLLGSALVSFIHVLVLLCFPNFVYDCVSLQWLFLLGVVLFFICSICFLFVCCSFFFFH